MNLVTPKKSVVIPGIVTPSPSIGLLISCRLVVDVKPGATETELASCPKSIGNEVTLPLALYPNIVPVPFT